MSIYQIVAVSYFFVNLIGGLYSLYHDLFIKPDKSYTKEFDDFRIEYMKSLSKKARMIESLISFILSLLFWLPVKIIQPYVKM